MNADCDSISALKAAVAAGMLSASEMAQRLSAAIEAEYMKDQPRMDFINACEDLLREIRTDGTLPFVSRVKEDETFIQSRTKVRTQPSFPVWLKGCAAAAALLLIAVFGVHHGRIAWMTGETIDDGERYLLQGHEINLEFIQNAIADHEEEARFASESLEETIGYLGFVPQLPDLSALNVQRTSYSVSILPVYIKLTVTYDLGQDKNILFTSTWFTDAEYAYFTLEQNGEGAVEHIAGRDVYCYTNTDMPGFAWSDELAVHMLVGDFSLDDGRRAVTDLLLASKGMSAEFVQSVINVHGETDVETESFDEVIDLLGFTPLLPDMSGLNVAQTMYYLTISEGYIFLDVLYERDPTALNVVYSISWYTDEEEAYLTVHQSGEGEDVRIAGTDVYCYMNINRPGFIWCEGLTVYVISGGWTEEEGRAVVRSMLAEKP